MTQGADAPQSGRAGAEVTEGELPAVDFSTFVLSLAHSALVHLGEAPDPASGRSVPQNIPMARQTIDLIALLSEKTKGNLTGAEERLVEQLLYDLQLRCVEVSKKSGR